MTLLLTLEGWAGLEDDTSLDLNQLITHSQHLNQSGGLLRSGNLML